MAKCRLCYSDANVELSKNIFSTKFDPPIWKMVEHLTSLMIIENDPYTKLICLQCFEQLKQCYIFRKMVLHSDWRIRHDNPNNNDRQQLIADLNSSSNDGHECVTIKTEIETEIDDSTPPTNDTETSRNINETICRNVGISIKNETNTNDQMLQESGAIEEDPLVVDRQNPMETLEHFSNEDEDFYKPFKCRTCNRRFLYMSDYNVHKRVHTGEKPYMCNTCGKRFTQRGALTVHSRVHTGEKPFSCSVCNKKFSLQHNLKYHMTTHNKNR